MSLEEAVDLVLFAFENGQNGDILVQKAPACTIQTQAEAVCELFGGKKEEFKVIGIRHGEKMYETLLTKEECAILQLRGSRGSRSSGTSCRYGRLVPEVLEGLSCAGR